MKWIGVLGLVAVFLCPAWAGSIPQRDRRAKEIGRAIPRQSGTAPDCLTDGYYTLNPGDTICVSTPGYPSKYPDNAGLNLQLDNVDQTGKLLVHCIKSRIQNSKKCKKDSLTINNSGTYTTYCGKRKPLPFKTESYWVDFDFESDYRIHLMGYICNVTALVGDMGYTPDPAPTQDPELIVSECDCGLANTVSRIVNGIPSVENEFPWLVGLHYHTQKDMIPRCGGVVYNTEWIITAAHCVSKVEHDPTKMEVLLGMHNYTTGIPTPTKRIVDKIRIHHHYNETIKNNNDIALLHMRSPVDYSHAIRPVCLPDPSADYTGKIATATGWGRLWSGGSRPDVAHKVQLPIRNETDCKWSYGNKVNENMICAGGTIGPINYFHKDTCQGDSGGPLTVPNADKRHFLAGLVSWGIGCAQYHYYGVYTYVPKYVDWITITAGPQSCTP